jgi:bacteriorhodopsin
MSTYILSALRLTYAIEDGKGHPVEFGRYIEWICTCPILILLIGEITKNIHESFQIFVNDYIMLTLGFIGNSMLTSRRRNS